MKLKYVAAFSAITGIAAAAPMPDGPAAGMIPDWLDANGDGVVSEWESQGFAKARKDAAQSLLEKWDITGDGVIDDTTELEAGIDFNGDGVLDDTTEREAAIEALKAKMQERLCELFLEVAGEDEILTLSEFEDVLPPGMPPETAAVLFGLLDTQEPYGEVTKEEFLSFIGGDMVPPLPDGPPLP